MWMCNTSHYSRTKLAKYMVHFYSPILWLFQNISHLAITTEKESWFKQTHGSGENVTIILNKCDRIKVFMRQDMTAPTRSAILRVTLVGIEVFLGSGTLSIDKQVPFWRTFNNESLTLKMKAQWSFKMSASPANTIQHHIPEQFRLYPFLLLVHLYFKFHDTSEESCHQTRYMNMALSTHYIQSAQLNLVLRVPHGVSLCIKV
jgi:hypothetical protein